MVAIGSSNSLLAVDHPSGFEVSFHRPIPGSFRSSSDLSSSFVQFTSIRILLLSLPLTFFTFGSSPDLSNRFQKRHMTSSRLHASRSYDNALQISMLTQQSSIDCQHPRMEKK